MPNIPAGRLRHLEIERFKSVRRASMECKKVNVFIGEPDTGKTNILEALQFISCQGWGVPVGSALRLKKELGFSGLFHQQFIDKPFCLRLNEALCEAHLRNADTIEVVWKGAPSSGSWLVHFAERSQRLNLCLVRHYSFQSASLWGYTESGPDPLAIAVPSGENLAYVIKHHEQANAAFRRALGKIGLRLHFAEASKTYYMTDATGEELKDYALETLSDSVRRLLFCQAILLTVENSVLVMDEPDVCAFPPYPKTLGEMIAADASNQFFLTTHNPYFLMALAEKTPTDNLQIFVCRRNEARETHPVPLTEDQVSKLIEHGPSLFFNLDDLATP